MISWGEATARYLEWLEAWRRAPGTIRLHRHYLRQLAELAPSPDAVTPRALLRFVGQRRWSAETRKSARSVVVRFYEWAELEGIVEENPTVRLPPVSVPPGVAKPAPERALEVALRGAAPRVRLMLLLAAYAGMRCGEIARVHREDLVDGFLYVVGKGEKQRVVPIEHPEILWGIRRADTWVFPNGRGHHLTPGHVTKLLSDALPDHWTGHKLRHRFATRSYANNPDLLALGQVLGHARPETTQRYVRVADDALLAVIRGAR